MFLYGQAPSESPEFFTQQQLRPMHLRQIFDLVLSQGPMSRADIARDISLSPTAVASLVDELLDIGVLVMAGQLVSGTAGRPPAMVEVNRSWRQIVTFCFDPEHVEYVLYDMTCQPIESASVLVEGTDYVDAARRAIARSNQLQSGKVIAVGLAVPAIADAENQRLVLNVLDMDDSRTFLSQMASMFPEAQLLVGNDSAAYAYAEKEYGSPRDVENLVYINYTHGIGAGIIVDGTIFNDDKFKTGEIGHMTIDMNGPQCICGNRGCLERVASVPAVLREARQGIEAGGYSVITKLVEGDLGRLDMDTLIRAYAMEDRLAEQVFEDMARKLSFGIRNVLCMFHPREVVIGGIAHRFGDRFLQLLRDHARGTSYWSEIYETEIRYTRIEEYGANLGMAKYYLDQVLSFDASGTVLQPAGGTPAGKEKA